MPPVETRTHTQQRKWSTLSFLGGHIAMWRVSADLYPPHRIPVLRTYTYTQFYTFCWMRTPVRIIFVLVWCCRLMVGVSLTSPSVADDSAHV